MAEKLLIAGGGTMGAGIALVGARAGLRVTIVEPQAGARERAVAYVEREAQRLGDPSAAQRIEWAASVPSSSDAAIAIEAVTERFDVKRDVFLALASAVAPQAILATNTSSLSVAELADVVANPERVLGLHFFNPATKMELLEIVAAPQTADEAVDQAFGFARTIGKTAVLAADTPGFIVNRVARPYYLQALRALERGVASVQELDALARAAGFRMGPFELMDLIGLDVNLATTQSIYARTEAPRFAPVDLQRQMVESGSLGRKTGQGFYAYRDGQHARFDAAVRTPPAQEIDADELVAVVGFGTRADEFCELLEQRYANVARIENDEFLDEIPLDATIVIDVGDGSSDRGEIVAELDSLLGAETVFFADAYATDLAACARRLRHPERLVGYGVLGALSAQTAVEIADTEAVSDDALELGQELFAEIGKGAVLVEDAPGLFLGRTVGSIVNEAMIAVADEIASPDDVDIAMRLGANYPIGPIAWGREIGGARLRRILARLAAAEGEAFTPHRSLWMLDLQEMPDDEEQQSEEASQ